MQPLNWLMNRTVEMSESDSVIKNVATRVILFVGALPLEFLAIAQNAIKLPFITIGMGAKLSLKTFNLLANLQFIRDFEQSLPGPGYLVTTALKVIGYAIGVIATVLLGILISPKRNFDLHVSLDLISNKKADAELALQQQIKAKRRAAVAVEEKAYIANLIKANSLKNLEKERLIAAQRPKEVSGKQEFFIKQETVQSSDIPPSIILSEVTSGDSVFVMSRNGSLQSIEKLRQQQELDLKQEAKTVSAA